MSLGTRWGREQPAFHLSDFGVAASLLTLVKAANAQETQHEKIRTCGSKMVGEKHVGYHFKN